MNLMEAFAEQVRARPKAPAIIQPKDGLDEITTFIDLENCSLRIAALLRREGVEPGDPVLIFQPISTGLYAALLAIFRLGAVAIFIDPSASRKQMEFCCEALPPRALLACPKAHLLRLTSSGIRRIPLKFVLGPWLPGAIPLARAAGVPLDRVCEPCADDAPALLTFTSGSTGFPKAVLRTHGLLLAQRVAIQRHLQLVAGEVDLATLPIFLLANLAAGLSSVIPDADLRAPGAICPEPVLAQIARNRVTRITASPAFFERLLETGPANLGAMGSLRKLYTGGAPVFPRLLERLCRVANQAEVEAVYGSTEAEPIAHLPARAITAQDRQAMRRGSGLLVGAPIPEINLHILRDQWGQSLGPMSPEAFKALELPPEQIGEIVVSGAHVLKGYLNGRGDQETKLHVATDVWHRTGDAGKLDATGRLWLLGRCEARVQDARGQLYPFAVECVATEIDSVRRSAFVAQDGRRVLAIEPGVGFEESAARRELNKDLPWAALDEIRLLEKLPVDKRHNAKIDYPSLRRLLATTSQTHK